MTTPTPSEGRAVARLQECLDAIEQTERDIQAWEFIDRARAIHDAIMSDRRQADLALDGLVVGIKDIFDTKDMPTCYGSVLHQGRQPAIDSAVVSRLRDHGAIILGKTVTTEFACQQPSRTRNPANPLYSPGGSSSGSAAAVAAGMSHAAVGSQTIGSVIRPASYCGVIGFKPSFGQISRAGVFSLSSTLDTVGIFARKLPDVVRIYQVLSGTKFIVQPDLTGPRPRFAACKGSAFAKASPRARAAFDNYVDSLRLRGVHIDEAELPESFESIGKAARIVHDVEVGQRFIAERAAHPEKLSKYIHAILLRAERTAPADYADAIHLGEACRGDYDRFLNRWDGLITLSATGEAPLGLSSTGDPIMSTPWTFLHVPCLSLPKLRGENGLPIGVQLIAARNADPALLVAASCLDAMEFHS
jgi:amidase